VSTLISAGYVLATKRFAGGNEPVALVARQGVASLLVTSPFILGASLNGGSELGSASIGCILLACLTGVIGFAVPYTLWTTSLPHVRPGFAAVALNLVPLMGVISATVLGQGGLSSGQWAGGALILVGLVLLTRAEMAMPAETADDATVDVTTGDDVTVDAATATSAPVRAIAIPAPREPARLEAPPTNPIPVASETPETPAAPATPTAPATTATTAAPATTAVPVAAGVTVRVVPVPRRPIESVPVTARPVGRVPALLGLPAPRPAEPPLPERIREVADAGMRRLRESQEANRQDRAHESLVGWLRGQRDVDTDVDVEVIALILNNAISHYQVMTDVLEQDPFGIEEDRYLTAVADLAAASLTR